MSTVKTGLYRSCSLLYFMPTPGTSLALAVWLNESEFSPFSFLPSVEKLGPTVLILFLVLWTVLKYFTGKAKAV